MSKQPEPIPVTQIYYNKVVFYKEHQTRYHSAVSLGIGYESNEDAQKKSSNREHDGILSESAQKNLVGCCVRFVYYNKMNNERKRLRGLRTKRNLKFLTLTLSSFQFDTDTEIRQIVLNQFLTELRQKFELKNYVWVAEKQENGALHFHMLLDIFIHWSTIREIWNRCQNKLGYVDRYQEKYRNFTLQMYLEENVGRKGATREQCEKRFREGVANNWVNPNSIDIHNVYKVHSPQKYFTKYFSKGSPLQEGFGRIWYASRNVSKIIRVRYYGAIFDKKITDSVCVVGKRKIYLYEYCQVIFFNVMAFKDLHRLEPFAMFELLNSNHSLLF